MGLQDFHKDMISDGSSTNAQGARQRNRRRIGTPNNRVNILINGEVENCHDHANGGRRGGGRHGMMIDHDTVP